MKIEKDFIIGAAISAYQTEGAVKEGNKVPVIWDREYHKADSKFNGDTACNFYYKYRDDIKMASSYGIKALSLSLSWSRIITEDGKINEAGLSYYNNLIDCCLENGVEPFVSLHHFDTPIALFDKGNWLNKQTTEEFLKYARVCFSRFGKKVKYWITINEPWAIAANMYINGKNPPHILYALDKAVKAMHFIMLAHSACVSLYKEMGYKGKIGMVHIIDAKYPITDTPENNQAVYYADCLANKFVLDATLKGFYEKETIETINSILSSYNSSFSPSDEDLELLKRGSQNNDFLGINYYASHFISSFEGKSFIGSVPDGNKHSSLYCLKGVGKRVENKEVKTTSWGWTIYPQGLNDILMRIKEDYNNPLIYITENGLGSYEKLEKGTVNDDERIEYLSSHLNVTLKARQAGVNVQGFFIWSLFDLLSWSSGYDKRYGLFYTDFSTGKLYPKKSARWIQEITSEKNCSNV